MPPLNAFNKTVIALALSNLAIMSSGQAATITVAGGCTIQDAIRSANLDSGVGGCTAGAGADIIDINPAQTITLTNTDPYGSHFGESGLPLVSSEITIQGNGSTIERSTSAIEDFRIIALKENIPAVSLTLESITLTGGKAVYGGLGAGGAIFVGYAYDNGTTSLTLNNTTITGNYTDGDGGAIFASPFTVIEINDSTLSNNIAEYNGGAIYANLVINLDIDKSTISSNVAAQAGGGISIENSGPLSITKSTLSSNVVQNGGDQLGGGIFSTSTSVSIVNSTISSNQATYGSGLLLEFSSSTVINSTVTDNVGGSSVALYANASATFVNSVVANSQVADCYTNQSIITSVTNNWFQDGSCDGAADGDPMLGGLVNNGGSTLTHEPQFGSGLIDSANPSECPSTDQRGELRDVGDGDDELFFPIKAANGKVVVISLGGDAGTCDIGSVETPEPI